LGGKLIRKSQLIHKESWDTQRGFPHFDPGHRADIYVRRLDMVCEQFGTTPEKLARLDARAAYDFLVGMVKHYTAKKNGRTANRHSLIQQSKATSRPSGRG